MSGPPPPPPGYGPPPPGFGPTPRGYGVPPRYGPPGSHPSPSAPGAAIVGRVVSFVGIAGALTAATIWIFVGMFSVAAGPLCTECMRTWLPPVALGVVGSLVPLCLWTVALIAHWRHPLLLLWSLLIWPLLGAVNIWAIQWFAKIFS